MKVLILLGSIAVQTTGPAGAPSPAAPIPTSRPAPDVSMPNAMAQGPNCLPIVRQVQEAGPERDRDDEHRTLNRDPPAHLLLAVDRQVAGCREVTSLRRDAAPGATTFGQPSR